MTSFAGWTPAERTRPLTYADLTDRVENVLYIGEEALSDDWGANLLSAARVYKTFLKDLPDKLPTTAEARQTEQESMDNSFLKLGSSIITGLAELRTSLDENDRTTMANTLHGNFCEAHEFHMGFKDARKSAAESRSIGTALKQACFDRMYSDTRLPKSSLHIMAEENWRGNGSKPSANSIAWVFSAAKSDNTPKSIMDTIKMKELWKADMGSGESLDPV